MKNPDTIIRAASLRDVPRIMEIYDHAKAFMRSTGNIHQWTDGYPSREQLLSDIADGGSYVVATSQGVAASFFFTTDPEPTYASIYEGRWLDDDPYGVVHRAASDGSLHRVTDLILDFCRTLTDNLRIDTHHDNAVMQRALLRNGFTYCGIIYLADGAERLAYQWHSSTTP